MNIDDDDRYMYDDGRFADDDEDDETDDFDIPTYDELELQGRYYNHGSRSDYNEWRYYKIQELKEERREEQRIKRLRESDEPNEYNEVEIPPFESLSDEIQSRYTSRRDYEKWRNKIIRKRRINKFYAIIVVIIAFVRLIAVIIFIVFVFSLILLM